MRKFIYERFLIKKGFNFKNIDSKIWFCRVITSGFISEKQINSIKQIYVKKIKKLSYIRFYIKKWKLLSKKSLESRMGGGKGKLTDKVYFIKAGSILFEISGISTKIVLDFIKNISYKISLKFNLFKLK